MKTLALALSSFLLSAGLVTGAFAQSAPAPATPDTKPSGEVTAPAPSGDVAKESRANDRRPDMGPASQDRSANPMPGAETPRAPDVKIDNRTEVNPDRSGDVSASPRTSVQETRIFGLTPTAAVLVAAGIILVLVMGIIALSGTRTSNTRIDIDDRRL